jgi:protein-L-isoaspartate(D-aspartate) O-methyltransferase
VEYDNEKSTGSIADPPWLRRLKEVVTDSHVIAAMESIPRTKFIPEKFGHLVEEDRAVPIGYKQTISQPSLVGRMLEEVSIRKRDRVMEIGSGSGYVCALLSSLCKEVMGFERILELVKRSKKVLGELEIKNVQINHSTEESLPKCEKFDVIIVSAAARRIPIPLINRLTLGGRLICPVGDLQEQTLIKVSKHEKGESVNSLESCRFVPLIGKYGWPIHEIDIKN